jgi:NAD(P)-dependent dehydrogenase (short-subunit alcohol dehydrogenase family)
MSTFLWIVILIGFISLYFLRKYTRGESTKEIRDMTGSVVVITGASAGIGKETARSLLMNGAKVIFATRDEKKTKKIIKDILNRDDAAKTKIKHENAIYENLNLSSLQSVSDCARRIRSKFNRIDILINNAGVANDKFIRTGDNLESVFQTNHIAHTIFTGLLLDLLRNSQDGRIINVSSEAHRFAYYSDKFFEFDENYSYPLMNSYNVSKLANVFVIYKLKEFCEEGGRNFQNKNLQKNKILQNSLNTSLDKNEYANIKSVVVHPGAVYTEITRPEERVWYNQIFLYLIFIPIMTIFFRNEEMGAQATLHCCYLKKWELVDGGYYGSNKLVSPGNTTKDVKFKNKIYQVTYEIIKNSKVYRENQDNETFVNFVGSFKIDENINM